MSSRRHRTGRPRNSAPIREAFRENKLRMLQVVFVMGLTAMGFYFLSAYFVSYVQTTGKLSREQSLMVNAAALALYAVLLPIGGRLGDRFGRKPMLIAGSAALALLSIPSFMLVTSGSLPPCTARPINLRGGTLHLRWRLLHVLRRNLHHQDTLHLGSCQLQRRLRDLRRHRSTDRHRTGRRYRGYRMRQASTWRQLPSSYFS